MIREGRRIWEKGDSIDEGRRGEEVKKYPRFMDKQYINIAERRGGHKSRTLLWTSYMESPEEGKVEEDEEAFLVSSRSSPPPPRHPLRRPRTREEEMIEDLPSFQSTASVK